MVPLCHLFIFLKEYEVVPTQGRRGVEVKGMASGPRLKQRAEKGRATSSPLDPQHGLAYVTSESKAHEESSITQT